MGRIRHLAAFQMLRASSSDLNPMNVTQRASSFASAISAKSATTLLVHRTESGQSGYVISVDSGDTLQAARHLSHTVGARNEQVELPVLVGSDTDVVVGRLVAPARPVPARETQAGTDPSEVARLLANTIAPGSWVALVLRKPSRSERKLHSRWLSHKLGTGLATHHSSGADPLLMSVWAGSSDASVTDAMLRQVAAALPGFDVETRPVVFSAPRAMFIPGAVALGLLSLSVVLGVTVGLVWSVFVATVVAVGVTVGSGLGVVPSTMTRSRRFASSLQFPAPAHRRVRPRAPRAARVKDGSTVEASDGDYPLHRSVFMVGPNVVVGVVAPTAGAASGEAGAKVSAVPPAVLAKIGPMVGVSGDGPVHLSAADMTLGFAILGSAGSGKSQLLRSIFGWSQMERVAPCGRAGFPGERNTLVAFESKGDGAAEYMAWSDAINAHVVALGHSERQRKTLLVEVAEVDDYAIDMFGLGDSVSEQGLFFANAMRFAFGDSAIGDRSFKALTASFTAALAVSPKVASSVDGVNPNASAVQFAHIFLGGLGDAKGVALYSALSEEAARSGDPVLVEGANALANLYLGKSESARRSLIESSENKTFQLLGIDHWFAPARRKVSWQQILSGHRAVVINTGTTRHGGALDENLNQIVGSMLLYGLRNAIQRECSGWLESGRGVSIFSDELKMLSGQSAEVVTWFKDQGRSYGVRPVLATQRPGQLSEQVRQSLLDFETLISFKQNNADMAAEVAKVLSGGTDSWSGTDISLLEPYSAVVRAAVGKRTQSPFVVPVSNFESDRVSFWSVQGGPVLPEFVGAVPEEVPLVAPVAVVDVVLPPSIVDEYVDPRSNGWLS